MAILEKIRNRTVFLIVIIGLALFSFVISDLIGSRGFGSSQPTEIGKVNGEEISIDLFRYQVENVMRNMGTNATTLQAVDYVWNQNVRNLIFEEQFEKIGLNVGKEQILSILSKNEMIANNPQFLNEYGVFDADKFINFIASLKASDPASYQQWTMQEEAIVDNAKQQIYFDLVRAGLGVTQAEAQLAYHRENDKADVKYVRLPYNSIADSTVNVTDSEIKSYINKHKKDFEHEAYRNIQYVVVEESASEEDIKNIRESLQALLRPQVIYNSQTNTNDTIPGFATTKDIATFVDRNSDQPFDSLFVTKQQLPTAYADTLFSLKKGEVFGPYQDGNLYKLSRMLEKETNGAVRASHILIAYQGSQAATPSTTLTREEAQAKARQILEQVRKNTDFEILARQNSDDPAATNGGDLGFFSRGQMVKPFENFAFTNSIGHIGIVETDFGFHVVKITEKADAVKIATIVRNIEPSEETINEVYAKVTKFEMEATDDVKNFGEIAKNNDFSIMRADNLTANDEYIVGFGNNRSIVQWAFEKDTQVGDIRRFSVPTGYVVAQVTKKANKGISTVQEVASFVRPILIREKKAEILAKKMQGASLEDIASENNVTVQTANALTMSNPILIGAGREPKVVGTAFALQKGHKSNPVAGENGVYVIELISATNAPAQEDYSSFVRTNETLKIGRATQEVYNALLKSADIEDNRSSFY